MLPKPSATFTLPSLYDDLELDCRLYFPRLDGHSECSPSGDAAPTLHFTGFSIFAHPYAPLGGCYDDPVVHAVGSLLIRHGFVLATFNFRGAEKSAGRTSWHGKAELGDYVSLYALALSFLNEKGVGDYFPRRAHAPTLLLGGYSYGSLMTAHLPDVHTVLSIAQRATEGSAEHEINNRAHELAQAFLGYCEVQHHRGRGSLKTSDALSPERLTLGGYESPTAASKIGREGRRSFDTERVRQSIDRVRRKLGSRGSSDGCHGPKTAVDVQTQAQVLPRLAFLLVSPLLGPVSSLATMFSKLRFERRDRTATAAREGAVADPDEMLSQHPSLAVFGSQDQFTSSRKVRDWCAGVKSRPASRFDFFQVDGAGHFWHDGKYEAQMKAAVTQWLTNLSTET